MTTLPDEKIHYHPTHPPEGTYAYEVDDQGTIFGPGWWPFYDSRSPKRATSVRLAPDTEYRAWANEYVLVFPGIEDRRTCWFQVTIYLRPQGMAAYVWNSPTIYLDIPTGTWICNGEIPEEVVDRVEIKVLCVFRLIERMRKLRRKGLAKPPTAHQAWVAEQNRLEEAKE